MVAAAVERLPPHNVEAEQSVLGSLLIDRDAIIRVASFLRPEDFYAGANGVDLSAILDLYNRREPTDFVTLSDELPRRERLRQVGGLAYLSTPAQRRSHRRPRRVLRPHRRAHRDAAPPHRRRHRRSSTSAIREGIDTEDALDAAERAIFAVSQRRTDQRLRLHRRRPRPLLRPDRLPAAAPRRSRRRRHRASPISTSSPAACSAPT